MPQSVLTQLGPIDIYLFDQILKGRLDHTRRVLDLGCGRGRNLVYFHRQGYDVYGVDQDEQAIDQAREQARILQPEADPGRFQVGSIEDLPHTTESVDLVMLNAVLHFARDDRHFEAMLMEAWRVLAPGGIFFARLASLIGIRERVTPLGDGRFRLPDGTERYLVDQQQILNYTRILGGELLDPVKTTLVQDLRSMTTWVLRKQGA